MQDEPEPSIDSSLTLRTARRSRILKLALPIIAGMSSQTIVNLVDTAMVGFLGDSALAAVGISAFVNFMAAAFIMGMAAGVQAIAARRVGEGRLSETAVPLNGGLLLALGISLPLSWIVYKSAPSIFSFLIDDPEVIRVGVPYLEVRLLGMAAIGMNFAFRGFWNAIDRSRIYLYTMLVIHVSNITISYVLIFGKLGFPELGVYGAGIGTTVAMFIGTLVYFVIASKTARKSGFLRGLPDREAFGTLLHTALPAGVQQFMFAAGMTTMFWTIAQIGTKELAAANVLTNLSLAFILPGMGFGIAGASLVGHALGRRDIADARQWGWDVARFSRNWVGMAALILAVFPDVVLGLFVHEAATLEIARWPCRIIGLGMGFEAYGMVLLNAHLGAGASRFVMKVSVAFQWLLFLPLAYLIGPVLGAGLTEIWLLNVFFRLCQMGIFVKSWRADRWTRIRV